jgi:outer membrane protein assembly factor BamA
VCSLGPGTYVDNSFFPDLSADIKLEANVEYRFDVLWRLKGAVFVDMGNIWAINQYDEREGALFRFDSFYREIAVGTGLGARFDFDFILFRIDLGVKLVDPELPEGKRWLYAHRGVKSSDLNWNFGIDYPF